MIKNKFESIFNREMTEENVKELMRKPFKTKLHGSPEMLMNWKKHQPKPVNEIENKALTCIYFGDIIDY